MGDLSRIFDAGRCVLKCSAGKFEFKRQCHNCHHTCKECNGNEPFKCTTCGTDKNGRKLFLYTGECRDACPQGHFAARSTCTPCSENCEACSDSDRCTRCSQGYYLESGKCLKLECGDGEVEDPDYAECVPCESGCRRCSSSDPEICSSCIEGLYMYQSRCYNSCPEKTYAEDSSMNCVDCDSACLSCEKSECFWCKEDFYLLDGQCVSDCGSGFYRDEDEGECDMCHRTCDTCTGPNFYECTRCRGSLVFQGGKCLDPSKQVIEGMYWDEKKKILIACHPSCKTCNGSNTNCTSCEEESFLHNGECLNDCPKRTFKSRKYWRCEKCAEGCDECSNNIHHCLKCAQQPGLQLYLHNGQCLKTCTDGFFGLAGTCAPCSAPCRTCTGKATTCLTCESSFVLEQGTCKTFCSENHTAVDGVCRHCPAGCQRCADEKTCTVCSPTFVLHEEKCLNYCPDGYYENSGGCQPCHSDCVKCNGPDFDDCEKCAVSSFVLYDGECHGSCPERTYYEEDTQDCQDCDEMCLTCSSSAECILCMRNMVKNSQGQCVMHKGCSLTEYLDEQQICRPCHKKCSRCNGPTSHDCLTCPSKHYLLNGTCSETCPAAYFADSDGGRCSSCHRTCATCSGKQSSDCLTCRPGWYSHGHSCSQTCMKGYYADNSTAQCKSCHISCKECLGPEPTDCLMCHSGSFLMKHEGRCYRSCPDHYYEDKVTHTCARCHPTCNTCDGRGAISCTSCVWSYKLESHSCISLCMAGEYLIEEEPKLLCGPCHDSCVECKGPGALNCTVCPASHLMYLQEGRCVPCCIQDTMETDECCDCTADLEECALRFAVLPPPESNKKTALFTATSILLILTVGGVVFFWQRSRRRPKTVSKAGYEKLPDQSRALPSYKTNRESTSFQQDQVIEYKDRDDEDEEEDDDDDIVYMGQDGTVYRKFKYGLLEEDEEEELEYDDESYSFR
ncbi:hypothetical protein NDU88_002156 [Pleurodeles waltl]|uniref:EGF-like domain-containing protein n=1 Tax=Pleurodeles waltl TaxID=8319 RepID=A0AAV7W1K6_PLEWA|nr:hypothetical protein NDU88_002156 [Pleurodeles waltl]